MSIGLILIASLLLASCSVAVCTTRSARRDRDAEAHWLEDDAPFWDALRSG